ncbi:MAG: CBS domain-containing protein, partial [Anaerolineae bacterium]|nr:CBS domain-containing protein [Anaerolineae bacterium]
LFIIKDAFAYISQIPRWLKPAITGLLLGIIGLFLPQVLGIGYVTIGNILNGSITDVSLLLILMVAKLFLTPTSLAGGFIGGVFAPSLFIGATLGGAFGQISNIVFPALGINPATFAMVGMAAVLAGSVHAPLTAIILLFEMTNDYHIILPVMFAVVVSQVTSQRLVQDSVYTLSLRRKGIRLERGKDVEILQTILVQEVMQPAAFTLRDTDSLSHASEFFFKTHHHGAPVLNAQNELVGIFTLQDMDATDADQWSSVSIGEACTHDLIVAYPDETIGSALRKMAQRDVGRMPVVSPENPRTLLGLLRRTDVIRAYDAALTRKAAMRHRIHQLQLGALAPSDMHVEEFQVEQGTVCANKPVRDVAWPVDCLVASIRRKGQIVVPHGDTVIRPGDVLVLITESSCIDELSKIDNTPEEHNPG